MFSNFLEPLFLEYKKANHWESVLELLTIDAQNELVLLCIRTMKKALQIYCFLFEEKQFLFLQQNNLQLNHDDLNDWNKNLSTPQLQEQMFHKAPIENSKLLKLHNQPSLVARSTNRVRCQYYLQRQ